MHFTPQFPSADGIIQQVFHFQETWNSENRKGHCLQVSIQFHFSFFYLPYMGIPWEKLGIKVKGV